MTLSDRIRGNVRLSKKMGVETALTTEKSVLCHYIEYLTQRGFPLSGVLPKRRGKCTFSRRQDPP